MVSEEEQACARSICLTPTLLPSDKCPRVKGAAATNFGLEQGLPSGSVDHSYTTWMGKRRVLGGAGHVGTGAGSRSIRKTLGRTDVWGSRPKQV
jgi:hypothetical protein